jgi:hypothetical protein
MLATYARMLLIRNRLYELLEGGKASCDITLRELRRAQCAAGGYVNLTWLSQQFELSNRSNWPKNRSGILFCGLCGLASTERDLEDLEVRRGLFLRECALDSVIRNLRIRSLKAQIEDSQRQSESFAGDFEKAVSIEKKSEIARKWDQAMKAKHAAQVLLEMLQRQQKDERAKRGQGSGTR